MGLDPADGAEVWRAEGIDALCPPALAPDGRIWLSRVGGEPARASSVPFDPATGTFDDAAAAVYDQAGGPLTSAVGCNHQTALADGTLLVQHSGDFENWVEAFEPDGTPRWTVFAEDAELSMAPQLVVSPDGAIVHVSGIRDPAGTPQLQLRAYAVADGSPLATADLPGERFPGVNDTQGTRTLLALPGGDVVVATRGGDIDGAVTRLRVDGGAYDTIWQAIADGDADRAPGEPAQAPASLALAGDAALSGTYLAQDTYFVMDAATGALVRDVDLEQLESTPDLVTDADGRTLAGSDNTGRAEEVALTAFATDGAVAWQLPADQGIGSPGDIGPATADGVVFGRSGTAEGSLVWAVEPADGPGGPPLYEPGVGRAAEDTPAEPIALGASICQLVVPEEDGADQVLLARDDAFADALAGAPLAGDDSCILFTGGGPDRTLDPAARAEIDRVLPLAPAGTVRILGGVDAVSQQVEDELAAAGYVVERLAGPSRFETAVEVARRVLALGDEAPPDEALLAFGYEYADAVTGGAYGAETGAPVLLTDTAALHPATAAFLAESPSLARTRMLGGPTVIADGVLAATPGAERYGGANRMGTAVEITDGLWRPVLGTRDAFTIVNLGNYGTEAQYEAWTVALAAAPLAAKYDAPELGVFLDGYPDETRAFLEGEGFSSLPAVVLVGGVNVIAQDVADGLTATLDG